MAIVLENYNGARKLIATGAPQQEIDDSVIAPDRMWSSKKLIEISTSQFETTGNPVAVSPFAYSPLGVKINFTPKQSGTGDPSPDNIRPISGYDEVTANLRGNNLLDPASFTAGILNSDGGINNSQDYKTTGFISVIAGARISHTYTGANGNYFYNAEKQFISNITSTTGVDITVPDNAVYLRFSATNDNAEVMVNFGKALLPYEPYQPGTTATLILPETIYGGTVDTVTGVGSEEWCEYTITGEENLKVFNPEHPNTFFIDITEHKNLENVAASVICSHFKFEQGKYTENTFFTQNPGAFPDVVRIVFVLEQTINSIQLAKEFFAAQASAGTPVTVCYKLATPSAFTSDGYKTIQPLEGVNTIYSDTDSVTVSGRTSWINLMEGGN